MDRQSVRRMCLTVLALVWLALSPEEPCGGADAP